MVYKLLIETYSNLCARRLTLLVFVLSILFSKGQSIEQLTGSVLKFYNKEVLSYSFEKTWYSEGGKEFHFKGDVVSCKTGRDVFYLLKYYEPYSLIHFENIKNQYYYGSNVISETKKFYRNYRTQNRYRLDGNDSGYIFLQTGDIKNIIGDKKYKRQLINKDSLFIIELKDTTSSESNLQGVYMYDKVLRYYVSKFDGRVLKSFFSVSGMGRTDSFIINYSYRKTPKRLVAREINNFKPLQERDENRFRQQYMDSSKVLFDKAKIFPDFDLPDTSGKLFKSKEITSKYVLIDFWYKNCAPCLMNMKNIEEVRRAFNPLSLEVLTINMADSLDDNLKRTIRKFNATFKWLMDGRSLSRELNLYSYPSTFIYEVTSKEIIYRCTGASNNFAEEITEVLKRYIKQD